MDRQDCPPPRLGRRVTTVVHRLESDVFCTSQREGGREGGAGCGTSPSLLTRTRCMAFGCTFRPRSVFRCPSPETFCVFRSIFRFALCPAFWRKYSYLSRDKGLCQAGCLPSVVAGPYIALVACCSRFSGESALTCQWNSFSVVPVTFSLEGFGRARGKPKRCDRA